MRIYIAVGAPSFVQPKESSGLLAPAPPLEQHPIVPQQTIVVISGCPYCQVIETAIKMSLAQMRQHAAHYLRVKYLFAVTLAF